MSNKPVKLSDIVASQLPDFVQNDYPTFVAFLEAYYKFLDNQKLTRNLEYIRDIDNTLDQFIGELKNEIAYFAPQLAHDRFFLKNSKAAYVARGSEESYRCLFRFLYNKEVEIQYPGEKMFRVSGGKWQQDVSFYLRVSSGDPTALENSYQYITNTVNGKPRLTRIFIKKVQIVETALGLYEIFVALNYYGTISIGDKFNSGGVQGVVSPSANKIKIIKAGSGFKVGQVFNISTTTGSGLSVKVVKVDENGGLVRLQTLAFGTGFKRSFFYNIVRPEPSKDSAQVNSSTGSIKDYLTGGVDYGQLVKYDYYSSYGTENYTGEVLADFYTMNGGDEIEQTVASLFVELGAVNKYPGFYESSESLVSDDSFIQDGEYYQDFSYVIKIDEKLDAYRDAILSCVHPVGRKLFGEFLIESDFRFELSIYNPIIRILIPQFSESDETVDMFDKHIASVQNVSITGDGVNNAFDLFSSPITYAVVFVKKNGVIIEEGTDWSIVGLQIVFTPVPAAGDKFEVRYAVLNFGVSSSLLGKIVDVEKPLSSSVSPVVLVPIKDVSKPLAHSVISSHELPIKDFSKQLPSNETLSSGATENEKDNVEVSTTSVVKDVAKPLAHSIISLDSRINDVSKPLASSSTPSDSTAVKDFTKQLIASNGYNSEAITSDSTIKDVSKPLVDSFDFADEATKLVTKGAFASATASTTDSNTKEPTKNITDTLINTDNGFAQLNPYATDLTYFSEQYQNGRTLF